MFGQLLTGLTWQELAGEQGAGGMRGATARKAAWLFPLASSLKPAPAVWFWPGGRHFSAGVHKPLDCVFSN